LGWATAADAQQELTITAGGSVAASCSIQRNATGQPFGGSRDFSNSGSASDQATVNCNKGFQISASSLNGALKHKTVTGAPTGFTALLPYTLDLAVPLDDNSSATTSCASSTLIGQSTCSLSSNNKTSINKTASLTVTWTTPTSPNRLLAGEYSDTITLTITPTS
jgi:hypothetical protein